MAWFGLGWLGLTWRGLVFLVGMGGLIGWCDIKFIRVERPLPGVFPSNKHWSVAVNVFVLTGFNR